MPERSAPPRRRLRVAFLLADNFTLSAFANFVDVLRLAADEADKSRPILCDWTVLSDGAGPIRSSCGVRIQPDGRLRDAARPDYLVVVGGVMSDRASLSPACLGLLRDMAAAGTPVVGLCTGVFILQQEGLLAGYRCCVSWFHHQDFIDRFDRELPVSDQIFVVDRDRLTCSGGHGAAHLAAFLVNRHIGHSAAVKSLNIMMIDTAYGETRPQPGQGLARQPRDDLVKRAVLRMQQNVEMPVAVAALASALGVARRTLERRFMADLEQSPQKVYTGIRLDRALQRLRMTDMPISGIAVACGFCDAPHLSRVLKAERGVSPAEYRHARMDRPESGPVGVPLPAGDGGG
ncbi:GlxA family transcriptional regulator [Mangrovicoccus algicola]|uniref:GlxA family transcriptional regulator n=1 Tax=Mangrovicoccus algicola TaxID=2771008 RepID=A0A8J7D024_9RHOB|nr:GlxA family transcriptional regulator [Mangrovicoccus algicola]MBE3638833.1 GlxA family transcriptional regulator [Mangrovicoccus algicola]